MKRSEINREILKALHFFEDMKVKLPPWGYWSPGEWKQNAEKCQDLIDLQLGWDLTDFGSGVYHDTGLLLFTLRNGNLKQDQKPYAEKIMIVEEGQITPMHFHRNKMEDIINRGGGNLMIQLYPSGKKQELADHDFNVSINGISRTLAAGALVRLEPGESMTLYPGLYHKFYGEPGRGRVLVGEVSSVNDDQSDNHFHTEAGRFPDIEEDEAPLHLLCSDYNPYKL